MRRYNVTTEFLKECISDALLKLLKHKPLKDITVSEVTDLAGVGRVTFYRNFESKEDALKFKLNLLATRWIKDVSDDIRNDGIKLFNSFAEFVYSIKDVISTLCNAGLDHIILVSFFIPSFPRSELSRSDTLKNAFFSNGFQGLIIEWHRGGFKETPQEIANVVAEIYYNNCR